MSYALIVHEEAYGTDGGAIGAALNTWYRRKLTGNPINEDTIVTSIDISAGNYAFTLGIGTYRIEAEMSVYISYSYNATADTASAVGVLYNDTDDAVVHAFAPTYMSDQASSLASTGNSGASIPTGRMVTLSCIGIFAITAAKTFSFRCAGNSSAEVWVANTNAAGIAHTDAALLGSAQVPNQYLVAKIIQKITA